MERIRRVYKCEIPETVGSVHVPNKVEQGIKTMDMWSRIYEIMTDGYNRRVYFLRGEITLDGIIKNELRNNLK